jgi:hypothetical protein
MALAVRVIAMMGVLLPLQHFMELLLCVLLAWSHSFGCFSVELPITSPVATPVATMIAAPVNTLVAAPTAGGNTSLIAISVGLIVSIIGAIAVVLFTIW